VKFFSGAQVTLLTNVLFLTKRSSVYDAVADYPKVETRYIYYSGS